jgi:large subunit ribosomal protein L23
MEFSRIILKPCTTEKTVAMQQNEPKKIAFFVDPKASKHDIEVAVTTIYGIAPTKINTKIKKPHTTRTATKNPGMTSLKKVAYVTFPKGTKFPGIDDVKEQVNTPENAALLDAISSVESQEKELPSPSEEITTAEQLDAVSDIESKEKELPAPKKTKKGENK